MKTKADKHRRSIEGKGPRGDNVRHPQTRQRTPGGVQESVDRSPRQRAEAARLSGLFGVPAQRFEAEAGPLQGRFEGTQLRAPEDQELFQGRFSPLQRQGPEEEELLQGRFETAQRRTPEDEELLQGRFSQLQPQGTEQEQLQGGSGPAGPDRSGSASATPGSRSGLPDRLRAGLEQLSGFDLSTVRVHADSPRPALLNALAYAQGNDIHLAPRQEQQLPHEAWHLVQQRQGRVRATRQMAGVDVNDDRGLEREADLMGAKAAAMPLAEALDRRESRADRSDAEARASGLQRNPIQRIGAVKLMGLKRDARAKHALMEKLSIGIQTKSLYSKLSFIEESDTPEQRAIKINMALAGKTRGVDPVKTAQTLVPGEVNLGTLRLVLEELGSMPSVDPKTISEEAVKSFAHYTKEGYENVTGIARGGVRYDKGLGKDRPMKEEEQAKGKLTLGALIENWADMPKFTGGTVYRVVHAGTGEDALSVGGTWLKKNPTSTSVSLDWSRVEKGKVCCRIDIKGGSAEAGPVDTRAVSTYTHEGEILLPPGTTFKKVEVTGDFTLFEAAMPSDATVMKTDLID